MPIKKRWKVFFINFYSFISLILLFVPFPKSDVISPDYGFYSLKGGSYSHQSVLPWRSFNQEIEINLNITEGKITLQILDKKAYSDWLKNSSLGFQSSNIPYYPYFQLVNITELNTKILLDPPFQEMVAILYIAEEDSTFYANIKLNYMTYSSNYGFFFLVIVIIMICYYSYKRYIY